MPAAYADASALTKLVAAEPESGAFKAFARDADLFCSELALAEVPRALRRIAFEDPAADLDSMLGSAEDRLDEVGMVPVESILLEAASALPEPGLRTLDAIHVTTALYLQPLDAFVTYDVRQAASAQLAGLRTVAPGT